MGQGQQFPGLAYTPAPPDTLTSRKVVSTLRPAEHSPVKPLLAAYMSRDACHEAVRLPGCPPANPPACPPAAPLLAHLATRLSTQGQDCP